VLTNIEPVARSLRGRCSGDHRHAHLLGGKAKEAARYPQEFCEATLKGIEVWKKFKDGGQLIGSAQQEIDMPDT